MVTKFMSGGEKGLKALGDIARKLSGSVDIGFMDNAKYPDGTYVASVAYWNEFGHQGRNPSPPRPFFRTMIAKESPTWADKMARIAKATAYDGFRVYAMMGEDIKGSLKESINTLTTPPLAQSTIDRKGFDKPLIDTTQMLNSADYRVNK